jgi:hypothetical protein
MNTDQIWNCEETVAELLNVKVPAWIEQDILVCTIASICNGGCASGSYMPAVTYHIAAREMAEHGDAVLDYILDQLGDIPPADKNESWSGMACFYLSTAIELWAGEIMWQLENLESE